MRTPLRHIPAVLVGVVALALSAGLAFAGQPSRAAAGLANAATHAGKTVPVKVDAPKAGSDEEERDATEDEDTDADEDADTETETDSDSDDLSDTTSEADHCATDPTTLTPDDLAAMNHGSVVCWAAHQAAPDGYANHGAFVSEWAKSGKTTAASTVTHGHKGKARKHH
jgi:hypothetical protein